jgi:hypothetical protein
MIRLLAASALSLVFAAGLFTTGAALAETKPTDKPGTAPKTPPKAAEKPADKKPTKAAVRKVTYACDGGVTMTVTCPPEAQAKTGRVKIAMKETTYFVRPAGPDKWEHKGIKLVFQPKGEEATIEREGKPLAEKCRTSKPTT